MTMQAVDGFHDRSLCIVIQCAGRFIQNQNLRIFKQRSRNSDSLTLTAGNPDATLANAGIQSFGKTADKLIQAGFFECLPDLCIVDVFIRVTERHIFADGGIDHENRLGNVADIFQPGFVMIPNLHAVCEDMSLLNRQQPQHNIHNRCLACAGCPHNADGFSGRDLHMRMVKDQRLGIRIFVYNIIQYNFIL